MLFVNILFSQDSTKTKTITNTILFNSYVDFTKSDVIPEFWGSYDFNKFSVEARYNYDWDKNISLYFGAALKHNEWSFRLMQGVTAGNSDLGLGISPLTAYDGKKIYIYSSPQVIFGITNGEKSWVCTRTGWKPSPR